MLGNVLTVQFEAGAIILFDFKDAFPSIEREFMLESLRWLGMPERQVSFIATMYHQPKVKIRAAGGDGEWFEMTRGIRQGCPLSPLIFAVVVDILLQRLGTILNDGGTTRAFADDTAQVLESIWTLLKVAKVFDAIRNASHLGLKIKTCVLITLGAQ